MPIEKMTFGQNNELVTCEVRNKKSKAFSNIKSPGYVVVFTDFLLSYKSYDVGLIKCTDSPK